MKYVSLDIETTGLRPRIDQILMVAMVVEDTARPIPVEDLPSFCCFIGHEEIRGQPKALAMNDWILKEITAENRKPMFPVLAPYEFEHLAIRFLDSHFGNGRRFVAAGKNVAGFDLQFLSENLRNRFLHRTIDAGSVLIDWRKDAPPSLGELTGDVVSHHALEDARDVIRVLRRSYGRAFLEGSGVTT